MLRLQKRAIHRAIPVACLLTLGVSSSVPADDLRSEDYAARTRVGLDHLYRLEYREATLFFRQLSERFPEHPGPPLSMAMSIWLEELFERQELDLDGFISPGYFARPANEEMDPGKREIFFDGIERSRSLAEQWLASHPGASDARYYLGACEAALGVFAFTIDRSYRAALSHGKTAYEIQKAVIEDEPDFGDSYLTVGTYEYIVGNLPWYIKWIAALAGYRGSEKRGFEFLTRAAEEGLLVQSDARVLLMVLYMREAEYDYALQMARQLHARYPENFIFHLNRAQILERLGRRDDAVETFVEVVERAQAGVPNYQKLDIARLRYSLGERFLALHARERALEQFEAAAADGDTPIRDRAYSNLRAGEILEGLGRYDEARTHYLHVRSMKDFDDSHRSASRRLRSLESRRQK